MGDEVEVSFTVKELLQDLNRKIDGFMQLLASKADVSSVAHAHERIDQAENRILTIEHKQQENERHGSARREFRRWVVPVVIAMATAAVMVLQVFRP